MSDVAISGLTALGGAPATNDLLVVVDVSDTTQAPTGTTKKMTTANLFTSPHMTGAVVDSGGLTVSAGTSAHQALTATTGSFSSTLTSTVASGVVLTAGSATTGQLEGQFTNTGGNLLWGVESSTGAAIFIGGTAYASVFGTTVAKDLQFATSSNVRLTIDSAGAATFVSSVAVTSNLTVNTNKFTVTASSGNVNTTGVYQVSGTQVLGARNTGWSVQSMTPSKINFGGSGAFTTDMLGAWASAVQVALTAHGILGA